MTHFEIEIRKKEERSRNIKEGNTLYMGALSCKRLHYTGSSSRKGLFLQTADNAMRNCRVFSSLDRIIGCELVIVVKAVKPVSVTVNKYWPRVMLQYLIYRGRLFSDFRLIVMRAFHRTLACW